MTTDALSVVIVCQNHSERLKNVLAEWHKTLSTLDRSFHVVLVLDGVLSQDDGQKLQSQYPEMKLISHEKPLGFGACLRDALPHCTDPLLFYTSLDYPYRPSDLKTLLPVIGVEREYLGIQFPVKAVNGIRMGREASLFLRILGVIYRLFCRVALGYPVERLPSWLGFGQHARSWIAWWFLGVPLIDPHSNFKLFRRELFDRFPLQSDGDFVHIEIFAKLTFLTTMVSEEKLSPSNDAIPRVSWQGFQAVVRNPMFHPPVTKALETVPPSLSPALPPLQPPAVSP